MRYIGPYAPNSIPSLHDMIDASTTDRKLLVAPLLSKIALTCSAYQSVEPDVETLTPMFCSLAEKEALKDLYVGKTRAIESAFGRMRDSLSPAYVDLCSFCSLDTNPDLDHFLPKSVFPEFSVFPRNLIPICTSCNRKKGNRYKDINGRAFCFALHDKWMDLRFLNAELSKSGTLHASYVIGGGALTIDQRALAERHFRRLGLQRRYSKRANAHLAALKRSMRNISARGRTKHISSHLQTCKKVNPKNGWEPVLYEALDNNLSDVLDWLDKP